MLVKAVQVFSGIGLLASAAVGTYVLKGGALTNEMKVATVALAVISLIAGLIAWLIGKNQKPQLEETTHTSPVNAQPLSTNAQGAAPPAKPETPLSSSKHVETAQNNQPPAQKAGILSQQSMVTPTITSPSDSTPTPSGSGGASLVTPTAQPLSTAEPPPIIRTQDRLLDLGNPTTNSPNKRGSLKAPLQAVLESSGNGDALAEAADKVTPSAPSSTTAATAGSASQQGGSLKAPLVVVPEGLGSTATTPKPTTPLSITVPTTDAPDAPPAPEGLEEDLSPRELSDPEQERDGTPRDQKAERLKKRKGLGTMLREKKGDLKAPPAKDGNQTASSSDGSLAGFLQQGFKGKGLHNAQQYSPSASRNAKPTDWTTD